MANWLLRITDGEHFCNSSNDKVWAVDSKITCNKHFIKKAKLGDKLWFVTCKSKGKIIGVASLSTIRPRETGPLISLTPTNEDRGWTKQKGKWDTDIYYIDFYHISHLNLLSEIKSPTNIRLYNDKCKANLPEEYVNIVRYMQVFNNTLKKEDL